MKPRIVSCRAHVVRSATIFGILIAPLSSPSCGEASEPQIPFGFSVTVGKAKTVCISNTLLLTGTTVPAREVLVRSDQDGSQIKEILVEAGDTVDIGQIMARVAPANGRQEASPIRAPIGGTVVTAPTVIGEVTSSRGPPLFRIIANGELELSAQVSSAHLAELSVGQSAKVKVLGLNETSGHIRQTPTTIDSATQLGEVRISLDRDPSLRVGAFGRAVVDVGKSCGITIPLSALLFGSDGPVVQLVRDDIVETRRVSVGLFAQSDVQIREGLEEGDTIVLAAGTFVREGDHVRPIFAGL